MKDTELDEILNTWTAPPVPPALRDRVRAGFATEPPLRTWRFLPTPLGKSLFAGAVLAAGAFLMIVTNASSQPQVAIPWTVDSEFLRYADDGSSSVEMYMTSHEVNGNEVLVSRSVPGDPVESAFLRAVDVTYPVAYVLHMHILGMINPGKMEAITRFRQSRPPVVGFISGCDGMCLSLQNYVFPKVTTGSGCVAGTVVDRATILNYPTEAVQERWTEHGRMTIWTASQLGCFALKVTYEDQRPDGTFRPVSAKQALKVTLNLKSPSGLW